MATAPRRRKKATPAQLRALKKARAALKRKRGGVKRKVKKNPTKTATARKRSLAAKKAAATRAAKARKRSLAAKKGAATRKRKAAAKKRVKRNPPAKKKTTTRKRRSTVAKRKMPPRAKNGRFKKSGKKTTSRKRRVRRTKATGSRWVKRKVGRGKKARRRTVSSSRISVRKAPRKRGRKTYRIARKQTKKGNYGYRLVRANPAKTLKKGAMFFAGLLGMRVLNNAIQTYGLSKVDALNPAGKSDMTAKLLGIVPSVVGFALATMVVPKLKILKGEQLESVKLGAAIALFDAAFKNLVVGSLTAGSTAANLLGEYVPYDNRLGGYGYGAAPMMVTVPQAGLEEYVPDNRYGMAGFEVSEALADEEIDFMQRGGAGGVFQKSVFGS